MRHLERMGNLYSHGKGIEASVHYCYGAGNKLCSIAHEVMDGSTELFRVSHAPKRRLTYDVLPTLGIAAVGIGQERPVLLCDEKARSNGVDADAFAKLLGTFCGHIGSEIGNAGLGCRISAHTGHRPEGSH